MVTATVTDRAGRGWTEPRTVAVAVLGLLDVIVATADNTIGMGGPAVIEGGGLVVVSAEDVGPASVQAVNGVIDVVVPDDRELVSTARRLVGYYQGVFAEWEAADQRLLRHLIPVNRKHG